jgi:hypothetical protein
MLRSLLQFLLLLAPLIFPLVAAAQRASFIETRLNVPLVRNIYTADPAAHVFDNKLYIYVSHDLENNLPSTHEGDQFAMEDYRVLSLANWESPVVDHGSILHVKDVPWAVKQMWAPDAVCKDGTYFLYFPAKDKDGIFRIGVATASSPTGPFAADPLPIPGSFSIDPCVFVDDDGQAYMVFGGLRGGQLERWRTGVYDPQGLDPEPAEPALGPRIARLSADMRAFDGPIRELATLDAEGNPLQSGDNGRRFFEGAWMHKYEGIYYLSYSTGDTHMVVYATADNPLGPFVWRGILLEPVLGWTTHPSIVKFSGRWFLLYHDSALSGGVSHLRCVKADLLEYDAVGSLHLNHPLSTGFVRTR